MVCGGDSMRVQCRRVRPVLKLLGALNLAAVFSVAAPSTTFSMDSDEDNYISYDSIVDSLSKKAPGPDSRTVGRLNGSNSLSNDPFEDIWIHAGVGVVQNTQNISLPNGTSTPMSGRGIQAALGIDILSPSLAAEGTVRSFGEGEDTSSRVSLKEFDLKIWLKTWLPSNSQTRFQGRIGGGLSARYMTVRQTLDTFDAVTPASIISIGGDLYFNERFSLGLDVSARNSMVAETFDRTSYDGTVRIDTHF